MLSVENLGREFTSYGETFTAVDGVTLSLEDGLFTAVVGKSGSGKSTLLGLLGTLDRPTSGTVLVDGEDVTAFSEAQLTDWRRRRIGFVFQSFNLIPNLSAKENVMLPMEFARVSAAERSARAAELLEEVGLDAEKQRRLPGHLSGGEQQRVAIARALANRPCLILADEPTGNLDSETGQRIVELLRDLAHRENVTVIAVTHDRAIAELADRTFEIRDGRLSEAQPMATDDAFQGAIEAANAAYEMWLLYQDEQSMAEFAAALSAMFSSAPSGRRLSPTKIRARYAAAAGAEPFEAVLEQLGR